MRFAVEAWAPEYGSGAEQAALLPSDLPAEVGAEVPEGRWRPLRPPAGSAATSVVFVDGVRRVDARVWITTAAGGVQEGLCASYAAGAVRCDGTARIAAQHVERRLFAPIEDAGDIDAGPAGRFSLAPVTVTGADPAMAALHAAMGALEVRVAAETASGDGPGAPPLGTGELLVVDGPLSQHHYLAGAVGSIKSQHRSYGPPVVLRTAGALGPGERTPVFLVSGSFERWSWYVRLPGGQGHPLAGVVRAEASGLLPVEVAVALADRVTATLPRFASEPHKDPRAPQNLYPIAGLERALRRRLGDAALVHRGLRQAAAGPA
ncbi:MAG: hypothetical protein ACT4PW_10335 [Acidimicrobiia bacterium]